MTHPYRDIGSDGTRVYAIVYRWFPINGIVSIYETARHAVRAKDPAEASEKFHRTFPPGQFFIAAIREAE